MIAPLYDHQKRIIKEDRHKCGLFLGTGASKTRTALVLAEGDTLVICPKQQRDDKTWERENEKWETNKNLFVISKEDLRKNWDNLLYYDTVIIDECHNNLGVQPMYVQRNKRQIPKTSQIFDATWNFLQKNHPKRLYLLSATPAPKPMSVWAIGRMFGQQWDFEKFRSKYYVEVRIGGVRRIWLPRKDEETKQQLASLIQKLGYTGGLNDFFDVPKQTHKVVEIELTKEQKDAEKMISLAEPDPLVRRAKIRTIQNGVLFGKEVEEIDGKTVKMKNKITILKSKKVDYILERALEFPKLLIFAYYKPQIYELERVLKKEGYDVSTLTGETKDRSFIQSVNDSPKPHIVIAQSSISSGYSLSSFPCVVYASKSYRHLDYEQSTGRVLRSNKLKKNLYIHLVSPKGPDKDCHDTVMSGQDFQERLTLNI